MGILLAALLLADQELPYPKIKPFHTVQLADLPHDYIYQNSLRNSVLIDPIGNCVLVFHHANLLTILDIPTFNPQQTITFGKPTPERITLQNRILTFHDRVMKDQKPEDRTYDLDQRVELRIPQPPYDPTPRPEGLEKFLKLQKLGLNYVQLLNDNTILTLEHPDRKYHDLTLNIRSAEDFQLIKSVTPEKLMDYDLYLSPDRSILALHSHNGSYTDLYSTKDLKRLRRIWNELGHLEFDPHNRWAANRGVVRWYFYKYGLRPLLVNLKSFDIFLFGDPPHGIRDVAIDSSLDLAVTIGDKTVDFYRLPK